MLKRLATIRHSFVHDWPEGLLHKVAVGLAKAVIVVVTLAAALMTMAAVVPLAVWLLIVTALTLFLLLLLINALVRWFPDKPCIGRTPSMPQPQSTTVDLGRVLGPYNSQQRAGLRLYDAVFEGGGVKAIAQIGALARFHEEGLKPRSIIGTSGGAIVGAALAAGATPERVWNILAGLDLTQFLDPRWLPNQRWLRRAFYGILPLVPGLVVWKGAVRGRAFQDVMVAELLDICGLRDPSFGQLEEKTGVQLEVVATDITRRRALVLPDAIRDYDGWQDRDPKELSVAQAVRMSMAIPFVFEPVRLRLQQGGVVADIVDGGVSSNYPIWHFDSYAAAGPRYPTFGFLLDEKLGREEQPKPVRLLTGYALNVMQAGIGAIDRILDAHDQARTIRIPTCGVGTTDFDLSPERQAQLFEGGYRAADEMLQRFVWSDYVKTYRGGRARIPAEAAGEPGVVDGVTYSR